MARAPIKATTWLAVVATLALFAAACGGADTGSETTDDGAADISRAAGTLVDPNLSLVIETVANGFGTIGVSQERALQGISDGNETCDGVAGPRARPQASQVEVEIVSVVDGCLEFGYDVADFRSFVADIRALRDNADVLAASPLLLEYRLNQLDASWPIETIEAPAFFARGNAPTGQGVVVAVIDSGIDVTHPGLVGRVVERAPDSGSGDYTATGHGTIAAALMVAPVANASRALAPGVSLLDVPADLCDAASCGCDPCAPMTPAEAIRWSVDNGADIISMSFGYQPAPKPAWWQLLLDDDELSSATETIEVALAYAEIKGVAMTAAAGNCAAVASTRCEVEDQFEIPAGHASVIGVGAVVADNDGQPVRAPYSTRQPYVELVAPGNITIVDTSGEPLTKIGTSYSTPFVSASLALLIGSDGPLDPYPNASEIARELLAQTASDLAPVGRDSDSGYGQINLDQALLAAREYADANPPPTPTATVDLDG